MGETYHPRGVLVDGFKVEEHPLYVVWASMKQRCKNSLAANFENYGGRGITYCDRWRSFANFAEDMYPSYRPGLTIERKNNDLGYLPENCRWATRTEQCLNRRNFKNNSTPYPGVNALSNGYMARYCVEDQRYNLGRFDTAEQARDYREAFIELLSKDPDAALKMTERRARRDGATGIKGITLHRSGKYVVRHTVNGKRIYVGSSTDLAQAISISEAFNGRS